MNYHEFKQKMNPFLVFSVHEIEKNFPDFDRRRLVEWQQKNYIEKIRNRFYCFSDQNIEESFLYYTANTIYGPSYISLESALDRYGIIPESTFQITSCTPLKTSTFSTSIGTFTYHHLKSKIFFAYRLITWKNHHYKIADLEKTIIDYLYLHPEIQKTADIKALRWNITAINEKISISKLNDYESQINSPSLSKRISLLKEYLLC